MTDSEPTIKHKKRHPITIVFGLAVIVFCLFVSSAIVAVTVVPTFAGIAAVMAIMFAFFPVFVAFGMIRFLTYAETQDEAWEILPCVLSPIILWVSGIIMCLLELTLFPEEVNYRSLRLSQSGFLSLTHMPNGIYTSFGSHLSPEIRPF